MEVSADMMADRMKLLDLWVRVDHYCYGMTDIGAGNVGPVIEQELREFLESMQLKLEVLRDRRYRTRVIQNAISWTNSIIWYGEYNLRRLNDNH